MTEQKWKEIKEDLPNVFSKYEMQEMCLIESKDIDDFKEKVSEMYFERKKAMLDTIFER